MRDSVQARETSSSAKLTGTLARPGPYGHGYMPCERCGLERKVGRDGTYYPLCRACLNQDGATPVESETQTPCYFNMTFFELENEVIDKLDVLAGNSVTRERSELARDTVAEAEQFCGQCPVRTHCLRWAEEEGYTGIAGGNLLVDGVTIDPAPRCRNGHELTAETWEQKATKNRCLVCQRLSQERRRARDQERRNNGTA